MRLSLSSISTGAVRAGAVAATAAALAAAPVLLPNTVGQTAEAKVSGLVCTDALGGASHYKLKRGKSYTSKVKLGLYKANDGNNFVASATENNTNTKYKLKLTVSERYGIGWRNIDTMGPKSTKTFVGCIRANPKDGTSQTYRFKASAVIGGKTWSRTIEKTVTDKKG